MNDTTNFIKLMQEIINTNSPATRLNAVYEFFRLEPNVLSTEEQTTLLTLCKDSRDKKAQLGRNDVTRRWDKIKEKKQKTFGWACIKSPYGNKFCHKCDEKYLAGEIVYLKESKGYHLDCAPDEAKQDELAQSHYNRILAEEAAKAAKEGA